MREAELSPPSELTFCLLSYRKGCSSGCFTRSQERSNEIRSRSVWTGRRHHTRRKGSIRLEQRTAAPVAGSAPATLHPAPPAPPLQPYRCLQTALHHEAPSHVRPRAMGWQAPAAGPALVRGAFTGAGRCRAAPAQSSLRPSCDWTSTAPCWPQAEPGLHSPGAVCALRLARPPGVTGAREVRVPPRPHPRPAKLPAALSRLRKDTAHNTHAIQKPKVHC